MDYEAIVNKALAGQVAEGWHPYLTIGAIPDEYKFNMDEVGADGNLKRKRKMGSTKQQVIS